MRAPNRPLSHGLLRLWPAVVSKDLLTSDFEQCFRLCSKDLLASDFEQCFRRLGGKWVQNGAQIAPNWLPNGSPEASGRPWGAEVDFRAILGSILAPILAPKIVQNGAEI